MTQMASYRCFLLVFLSTTIAVPLPGISGLKHGSHFYNGGQYNLKDCPTRECRCESWPYSNRTDLHCPVATNSVPVLSDNNMQFNWVYLTGASIKKLTANSFRSFHATRINLSGNNFIPKGSMPAGSFATASGNRLRELVLSVNHLKDIPCKALDLLGLEVLDLGSNLITELRRECFRNLKELKTLKLDRNKIAGIRSGAFKDLDKLETLHLSNNNLGVLKRGHLRGLVSLNKLCLSHNKLSAIEPSSFKAVKKLQILFLEGNAFTKLKVGIFRGLKKLKELSLRDNHLKSIEDGTFMATRRLRSFTFDITSVESLGNMTFKGLKSLTHLVLGEVGREQFPAGLLAHSHKLRKIDVTNYNSGFKGLSLNCFSAKLKLSNLVVQVTPLYDCSCDVTWIKALTGKSVHVEGQCYNIMQLTCTQRPYN